MNRAAHSVFALVVALALVLSTRALSAQQDSLTAKVQALDAVARFRMQFLGDSSQFAACSIYTALNRPTQFQSSAAPHLSLLLDRDVNTCSKATGTDDPWIGVLVDSVRIVDSLATIGLTVWRQENLHRQVYTVRYSDFARRIGAPAWEVRSATLSGSLKVHRGRNE
jgi:hypothetical protein